MRFPTTEETLRARHTLYSLPFIALLVLSLYLWLQPNPFDGPLEVECGIVVRVGADHRPGLVVYTFQRGSRTLVDTGYSRWPNPPSADLLPGDSVVILLPTLDTAYSELGYPGLEERRPAKHAYELRPPGHPGRCYPLLPLPPLVAGYPAHGPVVAQPSVGGGAGTTSRRTVQFLDRAAGPQVIRGR